MTETFSAEWLALREPADAAARATWFADRLADRLADRDRVRITDLGCGTGSLLRWLAPRLPVAQDWTLVDHDRGLLDRAGARLAAWAIGHDGIAHRGDGLVLELPDAPPIGVRFAAGDLAAAPLDGDPDLVAGSALLDLVSADWIAGVADATRDAGAAAYFALSYTGAVAWRPGHADDEWLVGVVNLHQQGDKGFGLALGPTATKAARAAFEARGYAVDTADSPWQLGSSQKDLQRAYLHGHVAAARQLAPHESPRIDAWSAFRLAEIEAGRSHVSVGHEDLLALPAVP